MCAHTSHGSPQCERAACVATSKLARSAIGSCRVHSALSNHRSCYSADHRPLGFARVMQTRAHPKEVDGKPVCRSFSPLLPSLHDQDVNLSAEARSDNLCHMLA